MTDAFFVAVRQQNRVKYWTAY